VAYLTFAHCSPLLVTYLYSLRNKPSSTDWLLVLLHIMGLNGNDKEFTIGLCGRLFVCILCQLYNVENVALPLISFFLQSPGNILYCIKCHIVHLLENIFSKLFINTQYYYYYYYFFYKLIAKHNIVYSVTHCPKAAYWAEVN
jgi:hypothetical protein